MLPSPQYARQLRIDLEDLIALVGVRECSDGQGAAERSVSLLFQVLHAGLPNGVR